MQYELTVTQKFEGPKTFPAGTQVEIIEGMPGGRVRVQTRRGNRFVVAATHVAKLPRT